MENTYAVLKVEKHTDSNYEKENVAPKTYPIDNGLIGKKESKGRLLESAIFQEIKRSKHKVRYLKTPKWELDFVVDGEIAVQVCYELNEKTYKRELKPFLNGNMFKKQLLICMYGYEKFNMPENVRTITAESFLLDPNKYLNL